MKMSAGLLLTTPWMATTVAVAQQLPSAYPSNGQSESKQSSDKSACSSWAQNQTGINPAAAS